ncbi:5-amino-6-(5-phospho-D-ribitylamino)uracil phosphatase YigB [Martelella alba]|uniref:5-amino-6-(5-phospho-D-ribitylamino)uracil phosphatase YigB n=1 Tax=Martelella alba TaxID=2590451 RepID=A0ABY2SGD0_9HYPH|nr:5-amino-6-(5-phospho-D-ribitylamino)uracil phosphatase YigB [Martelella alba]TKI04169.1 5-amino-6-(5-phospho-D-ribitylamino)uracil phosphatase YigB [Martelella alba]
MLFYRPLRPLKAITFDLDDTLYDNRPVIARTEEESLRFLQSYHPALRTLDAGYYRRIRVALREREPDIYHDVTRWRWRALQQAMRDQGLGETESRDGADAAMAHFARWRSAISVPEATHRTLRALSERWPLAAITNGNASPAACGLARYFQFVLRAGPDGRAKPFRDMYHRAAAKLGVSPRHVLHVGDDLSADINGAVASGMQACWINDRGGDFGRAPDARLLPHLEIPRLESLLSLL